MLILVVRMLNYVGAYYIVFVRDEWVNVSSGTGLPGLSRIKGP